MLRTLLIALIVVLFGLSGFYIYKTQVTPATPVNNKEQVRIAFSLGSLREERWQTDRELFTKRAQDLGAIVTSVSTDYNVETQISQIENLIIQGVKVIVIVPSDSEKLATVVEKAHKAGVKIIAYDRMIKNSDIDLYISFDNEKVGKLEAEGVLNKVAKGNIAYIGGAPTDNNSSLLKKGSMKVIEPRIKSGEINLVVDEFSTDWKPDEAYKNIKKYLTKGGKLEGVVAANDGTAFGVIQALKEWGLDGTVPVSGQDAELSALQRIVNGKQTMTVYKPIKGIAEKAAEEAVSMAKGLNPDVNNSINNGKIDVPSFLLEPIAVTKENINDTVIKDGFHTEKEIYQSIN